MNRCNYAGTLVVFFFYLFDVSLSRFVEREMSACHRGRLSLAVQSVRRGPDAPLAAGQPGSLEAGPVPVSPRGPSGSRTQPPLGGDLGTTGRWWWGHVTGAHRAVPRHHQHTGLEVGSIQPSAYMSPDLFLVSSSIIKSCGQSF